MPDFDPSELLETTYDGDSFNTHYTPFPETECYGRITKVDARKITFRDGRDGIIAEFMFTTDDDHVLRETGLSAPQVRYSLFLDVKPGTVQLIDKSENPNANVKLMRLKKNCGIKDGKKFRLADLEGLGCYIKTKQRPNPNDDEDRFCEVVATSAEPFRA